MNSIKEKKSTPYKVVDVSGTVKDIDLSSRTVTGLFNSYFYIDSDMDMLVPGAAKKSIKERGVGSTKGNKIKHLKDHDMSKVIARLDVLEEKTVMIGDKELTGIYHESYYPKSQDSNDMLIKISEGLYDSRSIGFRYMDLVFAKRDSINEVERKAWDDWYPKALNPEVADEAGYFWVVKEIMLYEGSDVAFGANELTPMLGMKSVDEKNAYALKAIERIERMENMLKNGSLSDEAMHELEVNSLQLKNIVLNLSNQEPSLKDTIEKNGRQKETHSGVKSIFVKPTKN